MREDDPIGRLASRRKFLLSSGALGIAALAGCTDSSGDEEGGEGGEGAEEAGAGLGGDDGDGGDGEEGGEPGDEMLSEEFDPTDPDWENNNYLGGLIPENDYIRGSEQDLEEMADRGQEEAVYGSDVRDPPDDESEWIDPDPIVFAELPREDSESAYQEQLQPMLDALEENTGRSVQFQAIDSYAAVVEGMRSERIHLAQYATGNTPFGVNLAGAVPFAVGVEEDGQFGYRMLAGTRADMDEIQSVEDFADHRIAHTEESSNSGHQAPSALFDQEFGLTYGENYEPEFAGGHEQAARGIAYGDFDAGPLCSSCWEQTVDAVDDIEFDDFKIVWGSDPFPSGPLAYRYNLHPDLVEGIRETWLDTDWSGTSYGEEAAYPSYVEVDYKNHWHEILVIQEFNGVEYETGELED